MHAFVDKNVAIALNSQGRLVETGKAADNGGHRRYTLLYQMAMETQNPYDLHSQFLNSFLPTQDTSGIAFGNIVFDLAQSSIGVGRTSQRGVGNWFPRSHF